MAGFKINKNKAGVYAYLQTPTNTGTPATANEFFPISGVFINNPIEQFVLDVDKLKYVGNSDVAFEIDWHSSFELTSANTTIHFGIAINSEILTLDSDGVVGTFAKNNNQVYAVSGTRVVTLSYGDTIQLQVASSSTSDTVTVDHFTTTISRFFVNY